MVAVGGYKYKGGQPEEFRCRPLTLRCAVKGISWIHSPLGQNRVARYRGMKNPSVRKQPGYSGLQTYVQTSDRQHGYSRYTFGYSGVSSEWSLDCCHKLVLSYYPNLAHTNLLPFLSSLSFLSTTKVWVFPLSKYNGQELKNELTWWLSLRAQARVIGPTGGDVAATGVGVGVDVSLMLRSSSIFEQCLKRIKRFLI